MSDRRVLVTDADDFVGPATVARFRAGGDAVMAHQPPLRSAGDVREVVADHGPFDVVVANLETPITVAPITEHTDADIDEAFGRLVQPLFWLFAECLPTMIAAGEGAIVVPTSATAIRSSSHPIAAYESARAAQLTLVRCVGHEVAKHGVRVNGIAPNFIENPSYFPPATVADPEFQASLQREVPAQRLGRGGEAAEVMWWLASPSASYVFGAIIPTDGGWTL
ncbi:MAG: SDR family oxidoreductase [Actinomycetota bacterium]